MRALFHETALGLNRSSGHASSFLREFDMSKPHATGQLAPETKMKMKIEAFWRPNSESSRSLLLALGCCDVGPASHD